VSNGDLESGSAGWTISGGAIISTYASLYHSATHYLWLGGDNGTDSVIRIYFVSTCHLAGSETTNFRVDDMNLVVTFLNPVVPVLFGVGGPINVTENSTSQYNAIVANCDGSIQSVTPTWNENSAATTISPAGLLTIGSVSSDTVVVVTATYGSSSVNYPITVVNVVPAFSSVAG
jgi:hypothetical protein